jgi:hypothetical protein
MSPLTTLLAAIVAAGVAGVGGFWYGVGIGQDRESAARERIATVERSVKDEAMQGAAAAIAANRPRNVTIKQETEREIQTRVEYRDCRHSPDQLQRLNDAITGASRPAGGSELPASGASR